MQEKKQSIWSKLFKGSGWALFTMFIWELIEEGLENLIAYALSSAMAIFITKALSTLAIITATQAVKVSIKRFLSPLIKTLTYKEGDDKMTLLKKFISWLNANKGTIISVVIGGTAGFFGAYFLALTYLAIPVWAVYCIAATVALICAGLSIYLGGEKVATYVRRVAVAKLSKEDQEKVNNAIDTVVDAAKKAEAEAKRLAQEEKAKAASEKQLKADKAEALALVAKKEKEAKDKLAAEEREKYLLDLAAKVQAEEKAKSEAEQEVSNV